MKKRKIFKRFVKRFVTWYGWMIRKKTLLSCFVLILMPLIICAILDALFFSALSFPLSAFETRTSIFKIGPIFAIFLFSEMIFFMFVGFNYTDRWKNYRFAVYENSEDMKKIQERIKPKYLTEYVIEFRRIKSRARKNLDPAEINEWMENFKELWELKDEVESLKSSKMKHDSLTMEERIEALKVKVAYQKQEYIDEITTKQEEIQSLITKLLPNQHKGE